MITYKRTDSKDKDFVALVIQLDRDLRERYGDLMDLFDPHNVVDKISRVIISYVDGEPAACGGLKPFDSQSLELKRMFVSPKYRRLGLAKGIIKDLEAWAGESTYSRIILETGKKQPEAIELYKKCGYTIMTNYGPYQELNLSVCMEKKIV